MKKLSENKHTDWRLSKIERYFYYLGDLGRSGSALIVSSLMNTFLMFQGINLVALAGFTLFVKIVDAMDDVVFGFLVDKIKLTDSTKLKKITGAGKYMPWFRLTFTMLPVVTILFFAMPNNIPDSAKLIWFMITYLLYDLACTLCEVPMNSMVMTLTDSVEERSHILKIKGVLMTVATIAFAGIILALTSEHVGLPVSYVAIAFAIIFLGAMLPMALKTKEYNTQLKNSTIEADEKYSLRDMLNCVKTNKYMAILLVSTLLFAGLNTSTSIQLFASFYVLGDSLVILLPTVIAFIPGIILDMNADKIAKKFGKKKSMFAIGLLAAVFYAILFFLKDSNVAVIVAVTSVACLPGAVRYVFLNLLIPDTIEYTRYKTGKDCSGIFYSMNSFVNKVTSGLSSSIAFFILGLAGWVDVNATDFADLASQGVTQTPQAISALWAVYTIVPAVGFLLSALAFVFYNIKDKDAELMSRCNAGEITREECEAQIEKKYE